MWRGMVNFTEIYYPTAMKDNLVITIGREFGSGGRNIGRMLAKSLGMAFYDARLIIEAAEHSGIAPEVLGASDEQTPGLFNSIMPLSMGQAALSFWSGSPRMGREDLYRVTAEYIKVLAQREPCVIVGRSADYVLRESDRCINLFFHAPLEHRVDRIMQRGDAESHSRAKALAEKTDRSRAAFYNFYTDKTWGDSRSYDLTFDSSKISFPDIVNIVKSYISARYGESI